MNMNAVEDLVRSLYRLGMVQRELARHALAELGTQGFLALGVIRLDGPVRVSDVAQRLNVALAADNPTHLFVTPRRSPPSRRASNGSGRTSIATSSTAPREF